MPRPRPRASPEPQPPWRQWPPFQPPPFQPPPCQWPPPPFQCPPVRGQSLYPPPRPSPISTGMGEIALSCATAGFMMRPIGAADAPTGSEASAASEMTPTRPSDDRLENISALLN